MSQTRGPLPPPKSCVARAWVFTWNNYPADSYDLFNRARVGFPTTDLKLTSCHIGKEGNGPGKTPHLQGVCIFNRGTRLSQLLSLFPGGLIHWEIMRGSEEQAIEYTKKEEEDDRLDFDDRHQGARTDLAAACALIAVNPRSGVRAVAAAMPSLFVKYPSGIAALSRALLPVPPFRQIRNVHWFYGGSGTGKTFTAYAEATAAAADPDDIFVWSVHNLRFAGSYSGQRYVIIDELRTDWTDYTFAKLITLLDVYRSEVEVKGSQVPWCATDIWITTPLHPQDFVTDAERRGNPIAVRQLTRRIGDIREFTVIHPDAQAHTTCPATPQVSPHPSPTVTEPLPDYPIPAAVSSVPFPPVPDRVPSFLSLAQPPTRVSILGPRIHGRAFTPPVEFSDSDSDHMSQRSDL